MDEQVAIEAVTNMLVSCATALFAEYGLSIGEPVGPGDQQTTSLPGETLGGIVGYTGDRIRGSVSVLTLPSVLSRTLPSSVHPDERAFCDWIGELANMLLGRLKNRLLRTGLSLEMAVPVSARGTGLTVSISPGTVWRCHTFHTAAGPIVVRFDAVFDAGFVFAFDGGAQAEGGYMTEGECLLF